MIAAQQADSVEIRATNLTKYMVKKLTLTKEQEAKVYSINLTSIKKIENKKNDENIGKKDLEDYSNKVRIERDEELKKVLTAEQFDKWIKMREAQKKKLEKENKGKEPDEEIEVGKMQDGC